MIRSPSRPSSRSLGSAAGTAASRAFLTVIGTRSSATKGLWRRGRPAKLPKKARYEHAKSHDLKGRRKRLRIPFLSLQCHETHHGAAGSEPSNFLIFL